MGDYATAEPVLRGALTIWVKALRTDLRDVPLALMNLRCLYGQVGDFARAEPPLRRALAIFEKTYGPECKLVDRLLVGQQWRYELKLDGHRALAITTAATPFANCR